MLDQNGNSVPGDLVLVYDAGFILEEINLIDNADWYIVYLHHYAGLLCVSAEQIDYILDDDPVEEYNSEIKSVDYVDKILHRYNAQDGFYHA